MSEMERVVLDALLREAKGHTREFVRGNELELKLGEALAAAKHTAEELLKAGNTIVAVQSAADVAREKAALRIGDLERVCGELRGQVERRDKLGGELLQAARGAVDAGKRAPTTQRAALGALAVAMEPIERDTSMFDQIPF